MFSRTAKSDGNYVKIVTVFTTLVLAMSGLVLSPAHATEVPSNGTYLCTSGEASDLTPNFTITNGAVTAGASCAGAVEIPEGVTSIGNNAFAGAKSLTSITIPASVTSIGSSAFYNATAITTVTFESGSKLTSISGYLFGLATSLTSITIPASVTSIAGLAFWNTTALTTVTFESGSKLTSIGNAAFQEATALTSITIPASVTTIDRFAFDSATALTSVYFLGNAPTSVGIFPFSGVADGAKAYIKSGATGFGDEASWNGLVVTIGVYTVTYNTSGGSAVTAQNYSANFPTPTSPTRTGYTFAGWSATAGGSVIAWPHTPASGSDITLYAKWTRDLAKAVAKVKPSVSGTAKVSKSLAAKKGTWTGVPTPKITYQWYSCSKAVTAATSTVPSTCKKISGETKSTLKLSTSHKGKYLAVLVTGKSTGTTPTLWLTKSTAKVG